MSEEDLKEETEGDSEGANKKEHQKMMLEYRTTVQEMAERMQAAYDKTVVTLSGAALGISLTFYKDIVQKNPDHQDWLIYSWICWTISIIATLASYYSSLGALHKTVDQVDKETIDKETPGGWLNRITIILGVIAGAAFVIGIICFACFVRTNFNNPHEQREKAHECPAVEIHKLWQPNSKTAYTQ